MGMSRPRVRVAAYVIRRRAVAELLGFDHVGMDDAGTQVPAGRTTFFLLRAPQDTPDAWLHRVRGDGADAGLTFACRFEALPLRRPLAGEQDAWLGHLEL